ncbi:hypothetical protein PROFUN_00471 [Planoprotostelium fungivorum]|uniref:Ubiquitin-related modifier 1 homolog n=1 Tax=Planoprotostelium fungivorum TaxID=1890364 RepID=A0A2P6N136_9EUKA|nr:hypothetical protein PROFUN_00471 [Planoprotostelium fungivorum]
MRLSIEFSGGLELLFGKKKQHSVEVDKKEIVLRDLLQWIKENLLKERPELFLSQQTVRPGILVLINDCDWELMGGLDYKVEDKDELVFISTLHGG